MDNSRHNTCKGLDTENCLGLHSDDENLAMTIGQRALHEVLAPAVD